MSEKLSVAGVTDCDKTEFSVECMEQKLGKRNILINGPADSNSRWQLMLSVHSILMFPTRINVDAFKLATCKTFDELSM
jgi:hypothetical protein